MVQLKGVWASQFLLVLLALFGNVVWASSAQKRKESELWPNSLVIHMPNHFFNFTQRRNWRAPGVFSPALEKYAIANTQEYVSLAKAQDKEDVWLFDHWIFGMKNGVMVESGALDGKMFSTSYMFETFANWTAVHIGTRRTTTTSSFVCIPNVLVLLCMTLLLHPRAFFRSDILTGRLS